MFPSSIFAVGLLLSGISGSPTNNQKTPNCRFALKYSQKDILRDPTDFAWDFLYWEGKFHQDNVSYTSINGMSIDGTLIDPITGLATEKHTFGAASKESLQIMLYAHAISGSPQAAHFLSPSNPSAAPRIAARILQLKLQTYLKFNATYPGFGGFLPWYSSVAKDITPSWDWVNRVPALDNGELLWAVYGVVQALQNRSEKSYKVLGDEWQRWLDYTKITLPKIFYKGDGKVCAVSTIKNQSLPVGDRGQSYACEGAGLLDDPYEGELITWWLYFFGDLSTHDKEALWKVKRPKLQSVEYKQGGIGPITVQKGYWFSSHEQWKVLEMPYYDVDIIKRVFKNAERVRTCNSALTQNPGMFASVNNSTDAKTNEIMGYISNAGIPSISNQTVQELDVITPYSVFPVLMFSKSVGLAWLKNIIAGRKMQNPYGTTESARIDGTAISSFISWDSKITTVIALLGGVQDLVRQKMKRDGIYNDFIKIATREYSMVFHDLKGENVELCLPAAKIPEKLVDYTLCK